ncbi:unnamed protein product [Lactuca saligna]|uniref:1,3-beta-glucan synthase component FKS1-like domain-containing protein n=1 Tax=Lactuca saligna TaxID=75948 RepID=A0AA35Z0Z5_LACSI|nr:unnamed protein product [Lactuca saligna]
MVLFIGFLKSTKVTATFDQLVSPPSVPSVMFKLAKKDGGRIDRNRDAQNPWDFYQRYKRVHRVDEIQIEEQRMLESGTFSSDMGGIQTINKDKKLFLVSLYYLIWGEAANVRFLPECICYRFHHGIQCHLDHGQASPAQSFICEDNSVSFLAHVIQPIYNTLSKEAERNNNGKTAHSAWRNYDDFNEYFWSPTFIFVVYDMNYLEIARYAFLFVLGGIFMAESVSDGEGNPMQKPNKRNDMESDSSQKEKEDDGQQLRRSHKYFTTSGVAARKFQIDNEAGQLYKELLVAQEEAHLAHQQLTSSMVKLVEERNMKPLDSNLAALSARCSKDWELNLAKSFLSEMGQCTTSYPHNSCLEH